MKLPIIALGAVALAGPALAAAPAGAPLQFKTARIGMSWAEWVSAPFPGAPSPRIVRACSDDPNGAAAGLVQTDAMSRAGVRVCAYVARYGKLSLPQAFAMDKDYVASDVRYYFSSGRLTKITFQTSVNAFYDVIARLKAAYGPPVQSLNEQVTWGRGYRLPGVVKRWTAPGGSITMTDPSPSNPRLMTMTYAAAGGAA